MTSAFRSLGLSTRQIYANGDGDSFAMIVKGATSRFVYLEKFSLNFSSSSFTIRVNLLHP